jgi:hypothetical protein
MRKACPAQQMLPDLSIQSVNSILFETLYPPDSKNPGDLITKWPATHRHRIAELDFLASYYGILFRSAVFKNLLGRFYRRISEDECFVSIQPRLKRMYAAHTKPQLSKSRVSLSIL